MNIHSEVTFKKFNLFKITNQILFKKKNHYVNSVK